MEDAITLKINGELVRFPGREAALIRALLSAREDKSNRRGGLLSSEELTLAIWGDDPPRSPTALSVVVTQVRKRVPNLLVTGTWSPGYELSRMRSMLIEQTRAVLPEPKKGRPVSPVTLTLQIDGAGNQDFRGREAALLRFMLLNKPSFRSNAQISLALGLDHHRRHTADKLVFELRKRLPMLLETGTGGRGWRIDQRRRVYAVYDAGH